MRWPLDNITITQGFHGINAEFNYEHWGTDLAANEGVAIKAPESGVVTAVNSGWTGKAPFNYFGGNYVKMTGDSGYSYYMGHMSATSATAGRRVSEGEVIGKVGMTGQATGPHVHFEMYKGGAAVDAAKIINQPVKEVMEMVSSKGVEYLFRTLLGRSPDKKQKEELMKAHTFDSLEAWVLSLQEYKDKVTRAEKGDIQIKDYLVYPWSKYVQAAVKPSAAIPSEAEVKLQTIKDALGIR